MPLQAIAVCRARVTAKRVGGVTTKFGGVDVVPLQGAIAGCLRKVPL